MLCFILLLGVLQSCNSDDAVQADKHFRQAREFQEAGELRAAMIEWRNLLTINPDHAEARLKLGNLYLEMDNGSAAEKELARAQKLGLGSADLSLGIVRAMLLQRKYEEALALLNAFEPANENSESFLLRGQAEMGLNLWEKAEQSLEQALERDIDNQEARLELVSVALRRNQTAEAEKQLAVVLTAEPENPDALFLQGKIAQYHGDPEGARNSFKAVLEHDENNLSARLELTDVLIALGELDEADQYIAHLVERAPNNPMVNFIRARAAYQRDNLRDAASALQEVLAVLPEHPGSLIMLGTIQFQLGYLEQSLQSLRRYVKLKPGSVPGRKKLAAVYIRLGQTKEALETLQPLMKSAEQDPQVLLLAANIYIADEEYEKANTYLEQAAGIAPDMIAIRTQLALSTMASGATDAAIQTLKEALKKEPDASGAAMALIRIYLKIQDYDSALQVADGFSRRKPQNPESYYLAALALHGKGKLSDARVRFEKALAVEPGYIPAALGLAGLDLQEGKTADARKHFEAILTYDANQPQALIALARMLSESNQLDEGLELVKRARKYNPTAVEPRLILIDYYLRKRKVNAALEVIDEAKKLAPRDLRSLVALGRAQNSAGDYRGAISTFRELLKHYPDSHEAYFNMALARDQLGNRAMARAALKKAIELKPERLMASHALGRLELADGNPDAALKIARQLQSAEPGLAAGYSLQGDVFFAKKDYTSAIAAYKDAMSRGWNSPGALKLYQANMLVGDVDAARSTLLQWLSDNPRDISVRSVLAEVYRKQGAIDLALAEYEKIRQQQPENYALLNNIAWVYHVAGDDRALDIAKEAYRLASGKPEIIDTYGWMLVEAGKVREGLGLLEEAVKGAPDNGDIRYHYASALAEAGEQQQARKELEALLGGKAEFAERDNASALLQRLP